jgi:LysR family transcriptional regulator for bpeEF and oprC
MDFLRLARIFVAVVDQGSFARAGGALAMARPNVTKAINELEAQLGARLLHRTTRRLSLTGEGELFYQRVAGLIAQEADIRNLFGGASERPRGRLRIDMPVAVGRSLLIPHLTGFRAAYPDIELILGVSDHQVDLLAEGVDVVLRLGPLPASSLIARHIADLTMIACASPDYLARHGMPRGMEDLAAHRAVTYFSGRGRQVQDWHWLQDGVPRVFRPTPALLVNDTEAFIECAVQGHGMILVGGASVQSQMASGALQRILAQVAFCPLPLSVMYPDRQYLAPQTRAFIDWAIACFDTIDSPWIKAI